MLKPFIVLSFCLVPLLAVAQDSDTIESDTIDSSRGPITLYFIGHGTLMFDFGGTIVHVDPWGRLADYRKLPKADIVLITHDHFDHLDPEVVTTVSTTESAIYAAEAATSRLSRAETMRNGDVVEAEGITIEAVPAYNIEHLRDNGEPFHPKGAGNGYVLSWGGVKIYVAGDTENIPEMDRLENIDVAFLPMNLPYTMTPGMAADAARRLSPAILYPYHFGETDPSELAGLLEDTGIDVRIRDLR